MSLIDLIDFVNYRKISVTPLLPKLGLNIFIRAYIWDQTTEPPNWNAAEYGVWEV